jgi:hypothetical protein
MSAERARIRIAVQDDYRNVALSMADWPVLGTRATVTAFNHHLTDTTPLSRAAIHLQALTVAWKRVVPSAFFA